jgi:anti-anti-sigma factor
MGNGLQRHPARRRQPEARELGAQAIVRIVASDPDFGAKRIAEEYNKGRDAALHVTERMVYEELKRLNMNTKELRLDYLRRHGLVRDADGNLPAPPPARGGAAARDALDDLLREIPGVMPPAEGEVVAASGGAAAEAPADYRLEGVGASVSTSEGITDVRLSGHIDSASSAGLERKLHDLTTGAAKVVVDLTDVSYVSSGGWGIFVGEVGGLRKRGGDIVLCGMTPEVFDVYELLGFADVLRSFATVAESRAWLSLPSEQRGEVTGARREGILADVAKEHDLAADGGPEPAGEAREWQSLRVEATTVGERGEIAVLSLVGIIDTVSAEKLRETLDRIITGGRVKIVADMSHVEYVSSGGWGVFTERLREVRRAGGDIKLFGMEPDVYYVFTMLGFNIVMSSFDIFSDAIDDFRRAAPAESEASAAPAEAKPARALQPSDAVRSAWSLAATPGLDLTWEDGPDGIRVARLAGVIETTAVSLIADELGREIERSPSAFVFDLAKVEYISSSGWGQFARAFDATRAVALVGMGPDLLEVYECLEFRAFIPAYATEAEALRTLTGGGPEPAPEHRDERPQGRGDAPHSGPPRVLPEATLAAASDDGLDDVLGAPSADASPRIVATPDAGSADAPETSDRPAWGGREWKDADAPSDLNVDAAVADRNKDRDRKLRSLGWERYGKRLRGKSGDTADGDRKDSGSDDGEDEGR